MNKPALTVGMAVVDDFSGVYFTIQAIRANNDCSEVEFVVVDNKPDSSSSRHVRDFLGHCKGTAGARYIPMPSPVGTAQPRNRVFAEAQAPLVLCMDSHVVFAANSVIRGVLTHCSKPSGDLFSGPLVYNDMHSVSTHFNSEWGAGMWGTWGQAWLCRCYRINTIPKLQKGQVFGESPNRLLFSVVNKDNVCEFRNLVTQQPVRECPHCGHRLPEHLHFGGHEERLETWGYKPIGKNPTDPPFEVPGMGLGLFLCRKDAWLGFNEHFRHFGGEELYIHEKFRQAGHKCICLPFLRWVHRFYRPRDSGFYPAGMYGRMRNYVLGFQELGLDLAPVYEHFIKNNLLRQDHWDYLLQDPVNHVEQN